MFIFLQGDDKAFYRFKLGSREVSILFTNLKMFAVSLSFKQANRNK